MVRWLKVSHTTSLALGSTTNSQIPNVIPRALYVRRAQIPEYREQFLFPLLYSWETTRSGLRDAVGNVRRPAATSSAGARGARPRAVSVRRAPVSFGRVRPSLGCVRV